MAGSELMILPWRLNRSSVCLDELDELELEPPEPSVHKIDELELDPPEPSVHKIAGIGLRRSVVLAP